MLRDFQIDWNDDYYKPIVKLYSVVDFYREEKLIRFLWFS